MNKIANRLRKMASNSDLCKQINNINTVLNKFEVYSNYIRSYTKYPIYFIPKSQSFNGISGGEEFVQEHINEKCTLEVECIIRPAENDEVQLTVYYYLGSNSPALHFELITDPNKRTYSLNDVKNYINSMPENISNILNNRKFTDGICEYLRDYADYIDTRTLVKNMQEDFSHYGTLEVDL